MATVANAPLPSSVTDPKSGPLTKAFGSSLVALVNSANEKIAAFQSIRDARTKAKSVVDTSDHPDAIAARELRVKAEAKLEAIKAEYQPELDRIHEEIKTRTAKVREATKAADAKAYQSVVGDIVSDVDPETLGAELVEINEQITGIKNMLLKENAGLKGWRPVGVSAASGSGSSSNGDGFKPRLQFASVDGKPVDQAGDYPTVGDVAKALGVNDIQFVAKNMLDRGLGGSKEALRTDGENHVAEFEVNNVERRVEFLGRPGKAKAADVAA